MVVDPLAGLSETQLEAVTTTASPLAVVAGPGSGKTRVLTSRVIWRAGQGDLDPGHALVLTFSRRAAGELTGRLRRAGLEAGPGGGVTVGTFHAAAFAALSRHRADRGLPPLQILGRPVRLLGPALAAELGRDPSPGEAATLAGACGVSRARGLDPGRPGWHHRDFRSDLPDAAVRAVWSRYVRAKQERGVLDLDDLLDTYADLLRDDPDEAAAARWRHRHIFVDEYQDLNAAHDRLLHGWVGGRPDVFVVGDPDQAVYGFNGASPDRFDHLETAWPGVRVVRLAENFRSTPEIVAAAGSVLAAGAPGPGPGQARRPPGPLPEVRSYLDPLDEAAGLTRALAGRHTPGRSWSGTAVLARTNARLRLVAAALSEAGVPWRLRDPRPLADRPAARTLLAVLPPGSPAVDLMDVLGGAGDADGRALATALLDYLPSVARPTVAGFASWLDATGVSAEEAQTPGIDLATFHSAKGLEWPRVWVVGVEEGLVPLATDPVGLAEERRLLYVAVSRAENELTLSWSAQRAAGGAPSSPSRWLAPLTAALGGLAARPAAEDQHQRLDALRRATGGADEVAARTRTLESWRAARARAAAVPAALILPDRSLAELARRGAPSEAAVTEVGGRAAGRWAGELFRLLDASRPGRPVESGRCASTSSSASG